MPAYDVRFTVQTPVGVAVTAQEVEDWLRFYLRDNSSLDGENPLCDIEPRPARGTFQVAAAGLLPAIQVSRAPAAVADASDGTDAVRDGPLLTLAGEGIQIGDIQPDELETMFSKPALSIKLSDERTVVLVGMTREECRACVPAFLAPSRITVSA